MKEPKWVSVETALALHDRSIQLFSGSEGVRDFGVLDSAMNRPRNAFAYEQEVSMPRLAALYAHGIAMNHLFVDGNKRTCFAVCGVFLAKNGLWLSTTEQEAAAAIVTLASGELGEKALAMWIEGRVTQLQSSKTTTLP